MTNRIRLALIGCGAIGRLHLQRLRADDRVSITVLCDPAKECLKQAALLAPEATCLHDEREVFDGFELDAVVLCSPTLHHYSQCQAALDKDLHILCEKPLATDRFQVEELIRRAGKSDKVFLIAYQRRYQAPYVTARRELQCRWESYGRIRQIHLFVCERWAQTITGTWRNDPELGSGYFGDAGSHQIDSIFFISGAKPQSVMARSDRRGYSVEIVTEVLAELTGGIRLLGHFVGDAHHWREDIHFHCERADLLLRNEVLFRAIDNEVQQISDLEPDSDPDRAFIDAILGVGENHSSPSCALPMCQWTDAVLRSI